MSRKEISIELLIEQLRKLKEKKEEDWQPIPLHIELDIRPEDLPPKDRNKDVPKRVIIIDI